MQQLLINGHDPKICSQKVDALLICQRTSLQCPGGSQSLSNKLRQIARQCESETFSCLSQRAKAIIWVCPAPTCGAYLRIFTDAPRFLWAWFRMFLLFCLMNLINYRTTTFVEPCSIQVKKSFFHQCPEHTDGGGCIDTELVFHDFTGLVCLLPQGSQYVTFSGATVLLKVVPDAVVCTLAYRIDVINSFDYGHCVRNTNVELTEGLRPDIPKQLPAKKKSFSVMSIFQASSSARLPAPLINRMPSSQGTLQPVLIDLVAQHLAPGSGIPTKSLDQIIWKPT